jgi:Undecaprenyl-phosphate glucose phosphotransferase
MIKQNQKYLNRFLVLIDAVVIVLALLISWHIRFKSGIINVGEGYLTFNQYLKPVMCTIPVYLLVFDAFSLYVPHRFKGLMEEFINILKANIAGLLLFILILFLFKQIDYSRYLLFIFNILCILLTTIERGIIRLLLRQIRKNGYNIKHLLIVGYSDLTLELVERLERNKQWGYGVVGILDDSSNFIDSNIDIEALKSLEGVYGNTQKETIPHRQLKVIGKIDELEYYLNNFDIDEVFITLNVKEYEKLGKIIKICEKIGVRTQIIPDYFKYIPARPYVEEVDGLPIINIRYVPLDNLVNKAIKRLFDIMISLICITLLSPIMAAVAVIIRLTSPGPILFKQERVGLNNKSFMMYKFRSMHVQKDEEEKIKWTTANDPRKTKFGAFIRKTSIDELPQIFNVLKGDMSLVGPRPERPYFVDKFKEEVPKYMVKHQIRPGITGWAQVNGWRGNTSIEKRIECDIYYIENWNFWLDVKIMFLTLTNGFVNKNAY